MRVAVATDNGMVSAHFGRCSEYTLADIEADKVGRAETVANPGHEPGFLPVFLAERGVEVVICGGAGPRAQALFAERGIRMCMGVSGPVEQVLEQYALGSLTAGASTCEHDERRNRCGGHHPEA